MTCGCNCCEACLKAEIARGQRAAIEMLDRWFMGGRSRSVELVHADDGGKVYCQLCDPDAELDSRRNRFIEGDSPESARANAAESVRHEL